MVHTQRRPHVTRIRAHRVPKCLQLTKQIKSVHNGGQFHSVHEQLAPAAHPRRKDTEHNTSCKHSDACYAQARHAEEEGHRDDLHKPHKLRERSTSTGN